MFIQSNSDYLIVDDEPIDLGSQGVVYRGQNRVSKEPLAVKVIFLKNNLTEAAKKKLMSESQVLQSLSSEYVVQCFYVEERMDRLLLYLEYCDGGNVKQFINNLRNYFANQRLPLERVLKIFHDLLWAFKELFLKKIVHRDIKPENILIKAGRFMIADFGSACIVDDYSQTLLSSAVGTPTYSSPQLLRGDDYTSKTDIWSLGLVIYEGLCAQLPWDRKLNELNTILAMEAELFDFSSIVPDLGHLLQRMLRYKESDRIGWQDLFNDPFILQLTEGQHKQSITQEQHE